MVSVQEAFSKDYPEDSKTMNDASAPVFARARAESTFNIYRKGWQAANSQVTNFRDSPFLRESYAHRGGRRVRELIEEGKAEELALNGKIPIKGEKQ